MSRALALKKERLGVWDLCDESQAKDWKDFRDFYWHKSKYNMVWWCNNFVSTYDPRKTPSVMPFFLFPKQEEILQQFEECYQNKQWGVFKKSRDVGATWMGVVFLVHKWLFYPMFNGGIGSRKAELVDRADNPDCIFEKARMLIRWLPDWQQPNRWEERSKLMLLLNPDNGSTIVGSGGDGIGRGGRSSFFFADEFAFVERSQKVLSALSQNTDCCLLTSTVNGVDNEFYKACSSGNYPIMEIHWKDDPRKGHWVTPDGQSGNGWEAPADAIYPWYEEQKKRFDPVIVAQEIDIDFTASVEGIYIPAKWVQTCINAHLKYPGIIDADQPICAGLDVAAGGANQSVLIIRQQGLVAPKIYRWDNLDPTQVSFVVDDLLRRLGVEYLCFDADGVGAGVGSTLRSIADKTYVITPFNGAGSPDDYTLWQGENKTSKQKFANRRAEAWGILRERIRKTYEMTEGINTYPEDELISIPNDPNLIIELSKLTIRYNSSGKILLQPKNELNRSPDTADALVYSFVRPKGLAWWV